VLDKLAALERISRQLDPDQDTRTAMLEEVQDYVESFLSQLPETKTFVRDEGRKGFGDALIGENPAEISQLLALFRREIDTTGINPASGGQCGYIPGGGLYPSALGDYLADVSNRYSGVSFAGPGAAQLELTLVEWLCKLVGYSDTAAGDLTSGGSIATLSAVVTARDAHGIGPTRILESCIYLTAQAHHCIDKALHVAGLKDLHTRIVPMDRRYRMNVAALKRMIDSDREQGLNPWMVVASAGTTDTGAIDPLREIGELARDEELWFHLDAAYGGFFLLCEEGRERLRGVEQADSIVLDPHKALCLPYGSGAVLIKDGRLLVESNRYYADYMQDAKQSASDLEGGLEAATSPADFSLELSRPFRGPRMWFPLKLFGLKPFRASLAEKIWLARYFHQKISQMDGFEAGPDPDLSIVTYRYLPKNGDANEFNRRLLDAVLEDGRIFISSTMIDGNYTLRLAVLHFRTHLDRIDYLLNLLQSKARELDG
jgi:glutamate/tyrosine decarboxylase-like PLP-dependent enzyme